MKTAAMLSPEPLPAVDAFAVRAPSHKPPERPPFPTTDKAYAKAKWEWIDQISLDTGLTPFQICVGLRLAKRHNMANGYAHPSHMQIAEELGSQGTRGIKMAIDALAERGHLYVEYSRGAGNANRYFLILKRKLKADHFPPDRASKRVNGDAPF